jgi:hypothetical protein
MLWSEADPLCFATIDRDDTLDQDEPTSPNHADTGSGVRVGVSNRFVEIPDISATFHNFPFTHDEHYLVRPRFRTKPPTSVAIDR